MDIKEIRTTAGMTQTAFAREMNVCRRTLSDIENGKGDASKFEGRLKNFILKHNVQVMYGDIDKKQRDVSSELIDAQEMILSVIVDMRGSINTLENMLLKLKAFI